jgi:transcriptional regulator with XRE-family HTH domain
LSFSKTVKETLIKNGYRPADLARMTGYSAQYISDLLAGERRWNEDSINKACEALGLIIKYETETNSTLS